MIKINVKWIQKVTEIRENIHKPMKKIRQKSRLRGGKIRAAKSYSYNGK